MSAHPIDPLVIPDVHPFPSITTDPVDDSASSPDDDCPSTAQSSTVLTKSEQVPLIHVRSYHNPDLSIFLFFFHP